MFESVVREFSMLPEIEAIALGGSRSGNHFDASSDYDIYLYCSGPIPEEKRLGILEKYCNKLELGNHFWELEDNGTFKNGIDFDILYRNLESFLQEVSLVAEKFRPGNAYTTCMWHNLISCKILYDKDGKLAAAQRRFNVPYPEQLRNNILDRGWKLLHASMPAYDEQIHKAAIRGDWVSVNHRVAAFLETYFDMLFALNRKTHPGEKRLVELCREQCVTLPEKFEENLDTLFSYMYSDPNKICETICSMLDELAKIL